MAMFTYKTAQAVACFGQVVNSVLQMPQGDSCGLLLDPSSVPSVGLPSDQCQILSLRESDGMRLTTAESGPNNWVHFIFAMYWNDLCFFGEMKHAVEDFCPA